MMMMKKMMMMMMMMTKFDLVVGALQHYLLLPLFVSYQLCVPPCPSE